MEPACKITRFNESDEYTTVYGSDESSDEYTTTYVPVECPNHVTFINTVPVECPNHVTFINTGPKWQWGNINTYGMTGFNLQYALSKKIWLMMFLRRVHNGWLYNYRHIPKLIFAFCNADVGTFDPNVICH